MPSKSAKQARTMAAAAHDLEFAAHMGIPQEVAREYSAADRKGGGLIGMAKRKRGPYKPRRK